MSAVSAQSPNFVSWASPSPQSSATQHASFWKKSSTSSGEQMASVRRGDTQSRIGLWVNGVAQWDDEAHQYRATLEEPSIEVETGFTPIPPVSAEPAIASQERPNLFVSIPGNEPRANDMSLSRLAQPRPRRNVVSVAPPGVVSKFNMTPAFTVAEVNEAYPFAPARSTPPPERPHAPFSPANTEVREPLKGSRSSSSCSSLADHDDGSISSKRSSATSVDIVPVLTKKSSKRLSGRVLSTRMPPVATPTPGGINKPSPHSSIPVPRRAAPARPSSPEVERSEFEGSDRVVRRPRSIRSAPSGSKAFHLMQSGVSTRSFPQLDALDQGSPLGSAYALEASEGLAEDDLQAHLPSLGDFRAAQVDVEVERAEQESVAGCGSVRRDNSVRSVVQPPGRAPTVPRRSRKREWRSSTANNPVPQQTPARRRSAPTSRLSVDPVGVRRSVSASDVVEAKAMHGHDFAQLLPVSDEKIVYTPMLSTLLPLPRITINGGLIVVHEPVVLGNKSEEVFATAASAEEVLLRILSKLTTPDDLFNTAMINKGMYRVYKENEMHLVHTVAFNHSPAAWEFREWCPPERSEIASATASSQLEHTPKSYTRCYQRDVAVIDGLKILILQQCQTFLRRETALALSTPSHPSAQRFDDAFWRIWCFCKIFGCGKNREDDVTGQLDWLKGGILANNQACVATVNTNLDFDMSSVILNAPDFFAKGNANGLSAQQLYDMTEIWTCLSTLLQRYQSRVDQARDSGIFKDCGVTEDDVEREEQVLEEWSFHLLTLGPAVVLEMAELAGDRTAAGFSLAKINGWSVWSLPQCNGTRETFLKEPVSRLYEERVAAAALKLDNPRKQEQKEMSRKRVATLAAEIRLRRQTTSYRRSPYIDMSTERPMSVRRQSSIASTRSSQRVVSPMTATGRYTMPSSTPSAPNFSTPNPMSSGAWTPRKISPIIEERVESFNRLSLLNFAEGVAEDTSARAVTRIVDMGFSAAQARYALRTTDMGDGLRVDRAVDLLLRQ